MRKSSKYKKAMKSRSAWNQIYIYAILNSNILKDKNYYSKSGLHKKIIVLDV